MCVYRYVCLSMWVCLYLTNAHYIVYTHTYMYIYISDISNYAIGVEHSTSKKGAGLESMPTLTEKRGLGLLGLQFVKPLGTSEEARGRRAASLLWVAPTGFCRWHAVGLHSASFLFAALEGEPSTL